jgi:uncharacterized membrane protein YeaQ/YmgE (transglycosylase-associated protein family)
MVGAILLGLVAGVIGRLLMPFDYYRHLRGPKSWVVSILLGLGGALLGYVIFTLGLGIGDDDIFDWGGIVGAIIGVMIVIPLSAMVLRARARRGPKGA